MINKRQNNDQEIILKGEKDKGQIKKNTKTKYDNKTEQFILPNKTIKEPKIFQFHMNKLNSVSLKFTIVQ